MNKHVKAYLKKIQSNGGKKGGPARAAALSPERRSEIATIASRKSAEVRSKKKEERLAREAQEKK